MESTSENPCGHALASNMCSWDIKRLVAVTCHAACVHLSHTQHMHADKLLVVRCLSGSTRCTGQWSKRSSRKRSPVKRSIRRATDPTPMTKTHRRLGNMRSSMSKQPLGCQMVFWNLISRLPLNPETKNDPHNPAFDVREFIVSHEAACNRPVQRERQFCM